MTGASIVIKGSAKGSESRAWRRKDKIRNDPRWHMRTAGLVHSDMVCPDGSCEQVCGHGGPP